MILPKHVLFVETHEEKRTPLRACFTVTRTALELAGGPEAMNDRFASRLGAFMRGAGEPFEVKFTEGMVVAAHARPGLPTKLIILNAMLYEWRDQDPAVRYDLCGYDIGRDEFPDDDSFLLLFNAVHDLVGDWPEMQRMIPQPAPRRVLLSGVRGVLGAAADPALSDVLPVSAGSWWQAMG
jgi:hypothetical protein